MRMIAIIDYDAGNIKSVEKALKYLGEDAVITRGTPSRVRDTPETLCPSTVAPT